MERMACRPSREATSLRGPLHLGECLKVSSDGAQFVCRIENQYINEITPTTKAL